MNINPALLSAVLNNPENDLPRLAYASWLDSQKQPERAEFVRLQCELAKFSKQDSLYQTLIAREKELIEFHGYVWAEEVGIDVSDWEFRRGFVACAHLRVDRSTDFILSILKKAPIQYVRDTSQMDSLRILREALPHFRSLRGLEFWGLYGVSDREIADFLNLPAIGQLYSLMLGHDRNGNTMPHHVYSSFVQSKQVAHLRELGFDQGFDGASNQLIQAVASSRYLGHLKKLDLPETKIDRETLEAMVSSPNFQKLEVLNLTRAEMSEEDWEYLFEVPWFRRLKKVFLGGARPTDGRVMEDFMAGGCAEGMPSLGSDEEFRSTLKQTRIQVDWDTPMVDPYYHNTWWAGQSWSQLA